MIVSTRQSGLGIAPVVVYAAIQGVQLAIALIMRRKGPQQKVRSSEIADQIEPYFAANLKSFEAGEVSKQEALETFDGMWAQFAATESQTELGSKGQNAIQERGRNGRPEWGKNWFELYRDPIEQGIDKVSTMLIPGITDSGSSVLPLVIGVGVLALVATL